MVPHRPGATDPDPLSCEPTPAQPIRVVEAISGLEQGGAEPMLFVPLSAIDRDRTDRSSKPP
jgi:hypothetical protein